MVTKLFKMFLFVIGWKIGVFPADSDKPEEWGDFVEKSSRAKVERLYRLWKCCSDLDDLNAQKIETILRNRLQVFEQPLLSKPFLKTYGGKIFWVHSFWKGKDILNYMQQQDNLPPYPFLVVDYENRLRGIVIADGFILSGVLNFSATIEEAELLYDRAAFKPLTNKDAELLLKYRTKVWRLMKAAGLPKINGRYLLVDALTNAWRGYGFNKKLSFLPKRFTGDYFLLAKM